MSMLKNLRRNSKQLFEPRRRSVVSFGPPPLPPTQESSEEGDASPVRPATESKLTFFDLPAEIRNVVYEHIARDTRIVIKPERKKSAKSPPPPAPALLLVSTGTCREFRSVLLAISPISVLVKEYDFSRLSSIIGSLYNSERLSLRLNPSIDVLLQIEKCNRESLDRLRRWLTSRADGLDRIPFQYKVVWGKHMQIIPTSQQVHRINVYIRRTSILNQNLEAMAQLHSNVADTLKFELEPLVKALEDEGHNVSTTNTNGSGFSMLHENSALMLYGLPLQRRAI